MRLRFLFTIVSLCTASHAAEVSPAPTVPTPLPPAASKPPDEKVLPLKIPGYELRVLDVQKEVTFNVGGTWTRASLPVFIYVPETGRERDRSLELLRKAYADLVALSRTREWSAADLQRVLVGLDGAIGALEKVP